MASTACARLQDCVHRYSGRIPGLAALEPEHSVSIEDRIALYDRTYPLIEQALWSDKGDFSGLLDCYQSLFREQDALIRQCPDRRQHDFILGIPVADRPEHLETCLESIYQNCRLFGYGGRTGDRFDRIRVVVAEDSRKPESIGRHLELVQTYRAKGLDVVHFGLDQQYDLLLSLPGAQRERMGNLLTRQPRERFYLKGQAANRNLCYLKFLQMTKDGDNTLYYLVDSDQSFRVTRQTGDGEEAVYALNYFHYVDRIFRETGTRMLTGKLVGDPPVSPSVMAANFLDDVTVFFERLASLEGHDHCRFHAPPGQPADDAAYHDMAQLFGFAHKAQAFDYRCPLTGEHDHRACLLAFARRLNAFFVGEHLTRKTSFSYSGQFTDLAPARTVYPGNYVVNYEGLKYIIPFGHLRLRMSGPTAGRLIQAEIGPAFASANLPMLHGRTSSGDLEQDFRPGVEVDRERIDLSDEFERQFFGDLMLFSTIELLKHSDVNRPFVETAITAALEKTELELLDLYRDKHLKVMDKAKTLRRLVFESGHWWQSDDANAPALKHVGDFIHNMLSNFSPESTAYGQINSEAHRAQRKAQMTEALMAYRRERDAWDQLF